jgi:hypothetical protein
VHVQANNLDVGVIDDLVREFEDGIDIEAELDTLDAGVGLGMCLGGQIRVDAQGDLREPLSRPMRISASVLPAPAKTIFDPVPPALMAR